MNTLTALKEARRLYDLGFAILWLHPKQKRPIDSAWTTGPRKTWEELESQYRENFNYGIRLGEPSKIGDNYLFCFDLDVKNPAYRKEAEAALLALIGGAKCPIVRTGSGNGSRHVFGVTRAPFKMITFVKNDNYEICGYSSGRQVVGAGSTHPNGNLYKWSKQVAEIPLFDLSQPDVVSPEKTKKGGARPLQTDNNPPFTFAVDETLDVRWLPGLSDACRLLITDGMWKGAVVTDRSAYLLVACNGLVNAGLDRDGILTVLTDPNTYLGECAYEHAKTKDRRRAAYWLWNYTVARVMRERDPQAAFEGSMPVEPFELDAKSVVTQTSEIAGDMPWQDRLMRTPGKNGELGKVVNNLINVHLILSNAFGPALFKFNEFSKIDEVWQTTPWGAGGGVEFQERDIQNIKFWFCSNFGIQPTDANLWSALIIIADQNAYHPIKEYFLALPAWDGTARLDYFLEKYMKGEAPKKYIRAISRKFLVAMIARVFEPGVKFDTMLVLEGVQGLRKSTAIEVLAGKAWFTDANLNLKHKDSIADMAGKWVLEQGEMNVMSKHDVAELKQFLSRNTDRMRPSYGRKSQDYPRQSVFVGTTNEDIYLKDSTGSRRFWPIRISHECDIEAIKRDRDQIFAEALARYRAGETIWISDEETNHLAKAQQEERETSDELTTVVEKSIDLLFNNSDFKTPFDLENIRMADLFASPSLLASGGGYALKMDDHGQKRVAACLKKLGYESRQKWEKGRNLKIWVKPSPGNAEPSP